MRQKDFNRAVEMITGDAFLVTEPFPSTFPRSVLLSFFEKHASLRLSELHEPFLKFLRRWAIAVVEAPTIEPLEMQKVILDLKGQIQ